MKKTIVALGVIASVAVIYFLVTYDPSRQQRASDEEPEAPVAENVIDQSKKVRDQNIKIGMKKKKKEAEFRKLPPTHPVVREASILKKPLRPGQQYSYELVVREPGRTYRGNLTVHTLKQQDDIKLRMELQSSGKRNVIETLIPGDNVTAEHIEFSQEDWVHSGEFQGLRKALLLLDRSNGDFGQRVASRLDRSLSVRESGEKTYAERTGKAYAYTQGATKGELVRDADVELSTIFAKETNGSRNWFVKLRSFRDITKTTH